MQLYNMEPPQASEKWKILLFLKAMLVNFTSQEFAKEANRSRIHEENVPTAQTKETQHAWLSCAHGHEARKSSSCSPSGKR